MTRKQVTKMHTYLLEHHYHRESGTSTTASSADNVNGEDYADSQYRLQLRLLTLMLARLLGMPTLDELLSAHYSDLKVCKCDINSSSAQTVLPMGDPGTGPNNMLMVGFGPDENGKDVVFPSFEHKDPNECCISALGDLLIYEQHKDPSRRRQMEWMTNPNAVPPFLFHKPGEMTTPLSKEAVRRDLVAALTAVGAPPYVESIATGTVDDAVKQGCDRHEMVTRTLAPPKPAVSSEMLWLLNASDFGFTVKALATSTMQSAGWKLQCFGSSWPLANLEVIQSRDSKKFIHKVMRDVNEYEGCTKCGKHRSVGVKLLKCAGCRTTLYCSLECQKAHWKTHKPDCKRIFPPKR
jgi:hypothetical protein